jgi:uncharacterized membrane protein
MSPRTIFLSKLLGLYCVLVGLAMFAHKTATIETMKAIVQNAPVLYLAGLIALAAGLAMVLGHNVWSGGALPVVVTLIGWLSLVKGLFILFVPSVAAQGFVLGEHYALCFYVNAGITLILGAYLTYGGFTAKSQ